MTSYPINNVEHRKTLYRADVDTSALRDAPTTAGERMRRGDFTTPSVISFTKMMKADGAYDDFLAETIIGGVEDGIPLGLGTIVRNINGNYVVFHQDDLLGTRSGTQILVRPSANNRTRRRQMASDDILLDTAAFKNAIMEHDTYIRLGRNSTFPHIDVFGNWNLKEGVVTLGFPNGRYSGLVLKIESMDAPIKCLPTAFTETGRTTSLDRLWGSSGFGGGSYWRRWE